MLSLGCALFLELMPAPGHAQATTSEVPGYREAVAEGLAEFEAHNYLEARRFFELAHQLFPNARTLRGLAVVSFELRRYSQCLDFGRQALASTLRPLDSVMRGEVEQLLARARELVAQLVIELQPHDALVALDSAGAKPLPPEPLLLDVGAHQLGFEAPGYLSQRRSWTVGGGEAETWNVSLRKDSAGQAVQKPALVGRRRPSGLRLWLGGASIGLGVAGLAAAGMFMARRHTEGRQLRTVQPGHPQYELHVQQWRDTRPPPYTLGAIGAVVLAAGAVTLLFGSHPESVPIWVSAVTGVVGLGLASWGVADLARGSSCPASSSTQSLCSAALERRDRGALLLLSAAPLLSVSLAQIVRRVRASRAAESTLSIGPQISPQLRMVLLDARVAW